MDVLKLTALLEELPTDRTRLLDNLGRVRREVGPITPELSDAVADRMNIRRGEVHEVVSFYSFLGVSTEAVRVCIGPVCHCAGARDLLAREQEQRNGVPVLGVECLGHCDLAPVLLRGDRVEPTVVHRTNDGPSLGLSVVDATLADYEERGGYRVLRSLPDRGRIVEELKASGLAGLGGAGFPTGLKWEAVAGQPGPRYVVVNADEGEPGTIKDRYVMELRPHLMLEGMLIAMRFAEATEGFIYLREEYLSARERLAGALEEARAAGLLDGLEIALVVGAGAYICGEETAMLESMEGRRGMPRLKPPFPSQVGYLGRPTLINNVETLAHIPSVLRLGAEAWAALGIRGAQGVRLWSISGAVAEPGCYEAPNGSTLRELIDEHAGGASEEVGAIVPGGAASGILPPEALDVPLTRDTSASGVQASARRAFRSFLRATPRSRCSQRRCDSSPRSPARSARRAGSATAGMHHLLQELGPRSHRHAALAGGGVARRDGLDVDLRARAGRAVPDAKRVPLLARALRTPGRPGGLGSMSVPVAKVVPFTLDGREVSAPEHELLVHAAARHGVFIPTLCHDDKLDPYGGCRMCVVGVEGSPRPLPACATRVAEGMVVSTNSDVPQYQRTLTQMLLAEHLNPDPGGRPNELVDLAGDLDVEAPFILPDAKREPYDDRNKLMGYDPDACILCNRCVRYTQEVMQCSALSLEGRGPHARVVPTHGYSWLDTECELCGGCLSVCPTGAHLREVRGGDRAARTRRSTRSRRRARSAVSAASST